MAWCSVIMQDLASRWPELLWALYHILWLRKETWRQVYDLPPSNTVN